MIEKIIYVTNENDIFIEKNSVRSNFFTDYQIQKKDAEKVTNALKEKKDKKFLSNLSGKEFKLIEQYFKTIGI